MFSSMSVTCAAARARVRAAQCAAREGLGRAALASRAKGRDAPPHATSAQCRRYRLRPAGAGRAAGARARGRRPHSARGRATAACRMRATRAAGNLPRLARLRRGPGAAGARLGDAFAWRAHGADDHHLLRHRHVYHQLGCVLDALRRAHAGAAEPVGRGAAASARCNARAARRGDSRKGGGDVSACALPVRAAVLRRAGPHLWTSQSVPRGNAAAPAALGAATVASTRAAAGRPAAGLAAEAAARRRGARGSATPPA